MTLPSYMRTFNPLRAISVVLGRRIASWRARHILRRGEPALRCADLPLVGVGDMRKQILSHGGHAEQIISSADRVVRGEYAIFSKLVREPRIVPDWKRDYCFGQEWLASTKYQPGPTDIKCIWEMNRLQFLPVVGLAFLLTEDQRYLDFVQSTLLSWNASNPVFSSPNWNSPMEVALRSISIVLTLSFIRDAIREGSEFFAIITKSLFEHGVFVECNLEIGFYGTRGNHFLSDILGLLVLGLAFRGTRRGRKWMRYSRGQLEFCIKRQVDDDGTYFEHSTSYHRLVLEIFTYGYLIGNQNGVSFSARYAAKLERMFECASCYIRPDGLTVQAGDADDGRVLILTDYFSWDRRDHRYLLDFGAALFDRVELVPSGPGPCVELLLFAGSERIAKLRTERPHDRHDTTRLFDAKVSVHREGEDYLMITAWDVGTNGIGNHQHNDILSFEYAVDGESFVVDTGCFNYTAYPALRNLFRSTAYHNTVRIDGEEINPYSDKVLFRMNEASRPRVVAYENTNESFVFEAEHYGYARLSGRPVHRRRYVYDKRTRGLQITDLIRGEGNHTIESFLHLDAGVIPIREKNRVVLRKNKQQLCLEVSDHRASLEIINGWVSQSYLTREEGFTIKLGLSFRQSMTLQLSFRRLGTCAV